MSTKHLDDVLATSDLTRWVEAQRQPVLSIVVPVRNEVQAIARTLGQLLTQDFDSRWYEIIVVDGESTDDTRSQVEAIISQNSNVRLLTNPKRLASAARNIGVRAAQGEYILIVDGHCEIKTPWLFRNVIQAFRDSGADCLGRPQPLDVSEGNATQRAIAVARSSWLGHHPDSFIYSAEPRFVPAHSVAVAYCRSVFDKVGYFDEQFDACEDVEFNTRIDNAGLTCYFTPAIAVHYVPRASLTGLFKQLARYGRGRVRLMRKHPSTFSWKSLLPAVFVAGVVVGLPLSFASRWLGLVYVVALLVYGVTVGVVSLQLAARRSWMTLARLPFVFATIHVASGWGAAAEALFGPSIREPLQENSSDTEVANRDAEARTRPNVAC